MTDDWGVDDSYLDGQDRMQTIPAQTVRTLRELIGRPPADLAESGPIVTRPGAVVAAAGTLELEHGGELNLAGSVPPDCPIGYHTLVTAQGTRRRFIVSPGRCYQPTARQWGWTAQLYATRSKTSWGMGDLADLATLRRRTAEQGGGFVMINPLHAVAPGLPQQASPYYPVTRRFRNPIYLAVPGLPAAGIEEQLAELAARGRALNDEPVIDRDAVWRLKREALELIFAAQPPGPDFQDWLTGQPAGLTEFSTWCALADEFGPAWRDWPVELRRPDAAGIAAFQQRAAASIRFHAWLQWLLEVQLTGEQSPVAVIQDLPIGVDPGGADAWAWQGLLADGAGIGAPPDLFNSGGQDWGMPPFIPWRLQQAGYQPFIDSLRATLSAGGGLRIDHIIGLSRLWWIPSGQPATAGGYVRYPLAELLDIICLESTRAGAVVVGEDLGTVEPAVRTAMRERGILSSTVFWFADEAPPQWPEQSMATVSTHDLPTVIGAWTGQDAQDQLDHGLTDVAQAAADQRALLLQADGPAEFRGDAAGYSSEQQVQLRTHEALAQAPCLLLAASLDDAAMVSRRPNIPGSQHRDNWCLALPTEIDALYDAELTGTLATILGRNESS